MQYLFHSLHKSSTSGTPSLKTHRQRRQPCTPYHRSLLSKMRPAFALLMAFTLVLSSFLPAQISSAATKTPLIILSNYSRTMKIGQEYRLRAFTSDLSLPHFSSSKRSVASVDSAGLITAKKAGSCKISVKSGKSIAYCNITVSKTTITLNKKSVSLEHGETFKLTARTSNGSIPTFKSNKKSVAIISDNGKISALKPGEAIITVKADQTEVHCKVKVKQPTITLSAKSCTLTVGQVQKISAKVSSGLKPTWSSSKSSVASVDQTGNITAVKAGSAIIKAKLDGVTATCTVTVKK